MHVLITAANAVSSNFVAVDVVVLLPPPLVEQAR